MYVYASHLFRLPLQIIVFTKVGMGSYMHLFFKFKVRLQDKIRNFYKIVISFLCLIDQHYDLDKAVTAFKAVSPVPFIVVLNTYTCLKSRYIKKS